MGTFYENSDLLRLADKVNEFYNNPEIYNYVHNGKKIPAKYEKLLERKLVCSNIQGYKSLHSVLSNAIKYSFCQTIKLNTSTDLRVYRETCERAKMVLMSLERRKQNGEKDVDDDIEKKKEEIKLLETQINDVASQRALKPEFNKNILTSAEEIFNLLLRTDKTPYYFYLEICKKFGMRVNLDQLFVGFRDRDNIVNIKKKQEENNDDDVDYQNFREMNIKKTTYVPPAFRKNEKQEIKLTRVESIMKKEQDTETEPIEKVEKTQEPKELFPTLNSSTPVIINKPIIGAWGKKPNIVLEEKPELKPELKPEVKVIIQQNNICENKPQESWESSWETMESF
jgi:hypothetical protein